LETRSGSDEERREVLSRKEDQFLDFKSKHIAPSKLQTHFVALANTDGGEIFVGIEDESRPASTRVNGFSKPEDANDVLHHLLERTSPMVPDVEVEFIDFGSLGLVLHVDVPKSPKVHYTSLNECYVRVNASTRRITGDKIAQLGYAKGAYSFERAVIDDLDGDDLIDGEKIALYLERIGSRQHPRTFLMKQKVVKEIQGQNRPTVAGVLLFDEEPQASLDTKCAIKVYRLQTTESKYKREYLESDPITIEGELESQINQVLKVVEQTLAGVTYKQDGALVKLRYPVEALKEILVNAVIHRDYSLNDDIHVKIYDNRIEVQSPGKFPGFVTVQNFLQERYSRNPVIVRLLHKLPNPPNKDIGEGLDTAFNEMRKAGLVDPVLEEVENSVVVTMKHQAIASLEDMALEYAGSHDFVTNKDVREMSGDVSEQKVKTALQKLRKEGLITPEDPNVHPFKFRYRITEKGRNALAIKEQQENSASGSVSIQVPADPRPVAGSVALR